MPFCIMRTQKIKSVGGVCAAISHSFRDRETPNADPTKTPQNTYSLDKCEVAIAKYLDELPDNRRKNAVVGVELMMTFSPEWKESENYKPEEFLKACDKWAEDLFGKDNVILTSHHFDETTPHTSVIICPKDENGKLNCRKFLGGTRERMRALQDDFYEKVGKQFELDRGVEHSRAKHQDIKAWYSAVKQTKQLADDIVTQITQDLPKKGVFEGNTAYLDKVQEHILKELRPVIANNLNAENAEERTRALNRTFEKRLGEAIENKMDELQSQYSDDLEKSVKDRTKDLQERLEKQQKLTEELTNTLREVRKGIEQRAKEEKEKKEAEQKKREKEEAERKAELEKIEAEHKAEIEKMEAEQEQEKQRVKDMLFKDGRVRFVKEGETVGRQFNARQCVDENMNTVQIHGGIAYTARLGDDILRNTPGEWFYNCYKLMAVTQQTSLENAIVVKDRPFEELQNGDIFKPAVFEVHEDKAGKWLTISDPFSKLTRKAENEAYEFFMKDFKPESIQKGSKYTIDEMKVQQFDTPEGKQTNFLLDWSPRNLAQDEKPKKENEPKVLELKLEIKQEKKKQLERERSRGMSR